MPTSHVHVDRVNSRKRDGPFVRHHHCSFLSLKTSTLDPLLTSSILQATTQVPACHASLTCSVPSTPRALSADGVPLADVCRSTTLHPKPYSITRA